MTRHISLALPTSISQLKFYPPSIDAVPRRRYINQPSRHHVLSMPVISPIPIQQSLDPILQEAGLGFNKVKIMPNYQQNTQEIKMNDDNGIFSLAQSRHFSESLPKFKIYNVISEISFEELVLDPSITISPLRLGFIPSSTWSSDSIAFGTLVSSFFRRRNSTTSKFPFKLYNALKITELLPEFYPHIGIRWIDNEIIWVDREKFARLIGVKTVEGGLFHQQGNFPSHGFVELSFEESERVSAKYGLGPINLSVMRLVRHVNGDFRRGCKESDIDKCKWKAA